MRKRYAEGGSAHPTSVLSESVASYLCYLMLTCAHSNDSTHSCRCLIGSTVVAGEGADSDADADDGVDISAGASNGADSSSYEDYYYAYSYQ